MPRTRDVTVADREVVSSFHGRPAVAKVQVACGGVMRQHGVERRPPIHPAKPLFEAHEKQSNKTGLFIGIAVVIGIALGVWITVSFTKTDKDTVSSDRPDPKIANSNSGTANTNEKTNNTLTELSHSPWNECETWVNEFCGVWTHVSSSQWNGRWGGVESNLTITISGKNVTVERRDVTQSTQATYQGTLNADNTAITGTVDWCCDSLGNRSGTWRAESMKGKP